jgi:hypothetical protein
MYQNVLTYFLGQAVWRVIPPASRAVIAPLLFADARAAPLTVQSGSLQIGRLPS